MIHFIDMNPFSLGLNTNTLYLFREMFSSSSPDLTLSYALHPTKKLCKIIIQGNELHGVGRPRSQSLRSCLE